jgi:outer membrane protein OmpA-like peptidoglycan-associated protein
MANGFLCAIFPYLLGLTLFLILLWPLLYLTRPKRGPNEPSPASVGILWLTPACANALGRCSQPGRLRSMSARGISARLDRYDFANERRPTREQYSTWPDQADLICQGKFDELTRKQSELIAKLGVPENQPELANLKAGRGAWAVVLDALLAIAFILAVLTLLNWILTDFLRACAPARPPCETCPTVCQCEKPPPVVSLKLSTDQEFEYDKSEVVDQQRLRGFLQERLVQFKNAKLTITGFTDPIGGACYNNGLAKRRAEAIADIVREIVPSVQIDPDPAAQEDESLEADKMIAAKCMEAFQHSPPGPERPLRFFSKEERDGWIAKRCVPDPKDVTPDHILGRGCDARADTADEDKKCPDYYTKEYKKDATFVALKRATNFYRLQRCLAPLRRVEIKESASEAGK